MHITNDLWLNFKLAQRTVDKIPGADLIAENLRSRITGCSRSSTTGSTMQNS